MDYNQTFKIASVLVWKIALWRRHHFQLRAVEHRSSFSSVAPVLKQYYAQILPQLDGYVEAGSGEHLNM